MTVLLIFTVTVLPVSIAFYSEQQLNPEWLAINIIVDSLFLSDVIVNFRTGVFAPDDEVVVCIQLLHRLAARMKHCTLLSYISTCNFISILNVEALFITIKTILNIYVEHYIGHFGSKDCGTEVSENVVCD